MKGERPMLVAGCEMLDTERASGLASGVSGLGRHGTGVRPPDATDARGRRSGPSSARRSGDGGTCVRPPHAKPCEARFVRPRQALSDPRIFKKSEAGLAIGVWPSWGLASGARGQKAPSSNIQAPEKFQAPRIKRCRALSGYRRAKFPKIHKLSQSFPRFPNTFEKNCSCCMGPPSPRVLAYGHRDGSRGRSPHHPPGIYSKAFKPFQMISNDFKSIQTTF
jgi:hypothetical protein